MQDRLATLEGERRCQLFSTPDSRKKFEGESEMIRSGGQNVRRAVRRALLISTSSLAATSIFAGIASAQDAAGSEDSLQEVVVTAQMREQNVQDIPLSITAVTGDLLEARSQ